MPKKCMLCDNSAEYFIKGCSETYCKECAQEQFQDLDYLQKIDESAEKSPKSSSEEQADQEETEEE